MIVIFKELVAMCFKLLYLFLLLSEHFLLFLVLCLGILIQSGLQLIDYLGKRLWGKLHSGILLCVFLGDDFVHLLEKRTDLILQFCPVSLHALAPDKGVFVRFRLYLCTVDILHIKRDKALFCKDEHQLGEDGIYLFPDTVAETVDGDKVRLFRCGKPYVMDVTQEEFLYLATGVDIVHIRIQNDLQHHLGMVRASTRLFVELLEIIEIQLVYDSRENAHGIIILYIFIYPTRKKDRLVGYVRTKVYLCHN